MTRITLPLAVALLASACAAAPATAPAPAERLIDVTGPVVDAARYAVQDAPAAVRVPYELARLDHIDLYLRNVSKGDAFAQLPLDTLTPQGGAFAPIVLKNLKAATDYEVRLRAYQVDPARGTAPVEVTATGNGYDGSTTAFTTKYAADGWTDASNEAQALDGGFKLKLRNQDFAGTATGNFANVDGKLKTSGGLSLGEDAPPPPPPPPPATDLHGLSFGTYFSGPLTAEVSAEGVVILLSGSQLYAFPADQLAWDGATATALGGATMTVLGAQSFSGVMPGLGTFPFAMGQ